MPDNEEQYTEKVVGKTNTGAIVKATKELEDVIESGGGTVTPEALLANMEGSDSVVVDLNEDQDKVKIALDQDVVDTINGKQEELADSGDIVKGTVEDPETEEEHEALFIAQDIKNKVTNSLQLPAVAPLAHALVGIDTAGAQEMIGVGEGLSVNNGVLKATGGGGTQLYHHSFSFAGLNVRFISNKQGEYSDLGDVLSEYNFAPFSASGTFVLCLRIDNKYIIGVYGGGSQSLNKYITAKSDGTLELNSIPSGIKSNYVITAI